MISKSDYYDVNLTNEILWCFSGKLFISSCKKFIKIINILSRASKFYIAIKIYTKGRTLINKFPFIYNTMAWFCILENLWLIILKLALNSLNT